MLLWVTGANKEVALAAFALVLLTTGGADKESFDSFACTVTVAGITELVGDVCAKTAKAKNREAKASHFAGFALATISSLVLIWP